MMRNRRIKAGKTDTQDFHSLLLLPYNPTPENLIRKIFKEISPTRGQLIYDLGCGDGRILRIAAQEFGMRAKGFEIDKKLILKSRYCVKLLPWKIRRQIRIYEKDLFSANLKDADIVFLYVFPDNYKFLVHVIQTCRYGCIFIFVKHEPDEEIKKKMEIVTEKKIMAEESDWLAFIARKA